MRPFLPVTAFVLAATLAPTAQEPAPQTADLPVRRVVLYKAGIGYFEHLGNVRDNQRVNIRFTSAQLDDVLKSLTTIDLGKGQVTGISYGSVAPFERRLESLRLPLGGDTSAMQVLSALRGVTVEVTSGATVVIGRLLSVEERTELRGEWAVPRQMFSVLTSNGDVRMFELSPSVQVRVTDRDLRGELGRYLDVVGSTREQDLRTLTIATRGAGERQLFVSYVSEVPIWKSTYRLVMPDKGKPFLQGWAIIDNTVGEDWTNVELSLVAGAPQSFIQQLSQPYFGRRPVVALPENVVRSPQTHAATLQQGTGAIAGRVVDEGGGQIPGARVALHGGDGGEIASTFTDSDGRFRINVAPGTYDLRTELTGFETITMRGLTVSPGETVERPVRMRVGQVSEAVTVTASSPRAGYAGGRTAAAPPSPPSPPPAPRPMPKVAADAYDQAREQTAAAQGSNLGEMFEYRLKEPVTLRKNQSALVPIVNAGVDVEKVSIWSQASGSGRPLRAIWLTNSSGLTLDGGSLAVIDGDAFAGEGLIEPLKPNEKRLVSYAVDLGVQIAASSVPGARRVHSLRVAKGVLVQSTEDRSTATYTMRNEGSTPTTVIVEHPARTGWKLAEGQLPVESTASTHRFRVAVEPGKEANLAVHEIRPGTTTISVTQIDRPMLTQLTASGFDAAELQKALGPVIEKRDEVGRAQARIQALQTEKNGIGEDQQRLRENMKALRGSAEERQLLQRYTRQLDAQEDRLAAIQRELESAIDTRDKLQAELARLIGALTFELKGV